MTSKTRRVAYWLFTLLFLIPMAGSGIPELLFADAAQAGTTMLHLGYPLYLLRILGFAKLLGALAIVTRRSPRLTEWAYAGYVFDLLGAAASHLFVGDGVFALVPMVMLACVLASLYLGRVRDDGAARSSPSNSAGAV